MRNDHALEIVEIGTIKLNMYHGTIRTIKELRYVKGLKKNLLSIRQLNEVSYKTHIENGITKVVSFILKAKRLMQTYTCFWESLCKEMHQLHQLVMENNLP